MTCALAGHLLYQVTQNIFAEVPRFVMSLDDVDGIPRGAVPKLRVLGMEHHFNVTATCT